MEQADAGHRLDRAQDRSAGQRAGRAADVRASAFRGRRSAAPRDLPRARRRRPGHCSACRTSPSRRRTGGGARFGEASRCWIAWTSCASACSTARYRWRRCRACGPSWQGDRARRRRAPARAPGRDRRALCGRDRQAGGRGARSADLAPGARCRSVRTVETSPPHLPQFAAIGPSIGCTQACPGLREIDAHPHPVSHEASRRSDGQVGRRGG